MFPNVPLSIGRKRVFDSVFPPAPLSNISPTPESTPQLGLASPEVSARGQAPHQLPQQSQWQDRLQTGDLDLPTEQITWDRAWHTATTYLSIPDRGFNLGREDGEANDDELDEETLIKRWAKAPPSQFVSDNIFYVGADASPGRERRTGLKECDLQEWYMSETRRHFLSSFRDTLVKELRANRRHGTLQRVIRYLRLAQDIYYMPLVNYLLPLIDPSVQDRVFAKLRQNLHAIILYSIPHAELTSLLAEELTAESIVILGADHDQHGGDEGGTGDDDCMDIDHKYTTSYEEWRREWPRERRLKMMLEGEDARIPEARRRLLHLLEGLQNVGLGGSRAQRIFAEVMNNLLTRFVKTTYESRWASPSLAVEHLQHWIENVFSRLVVQVLHILKPSDGEGSRPDNLSVTLADVEKWQEMGVARLGALRIRELFDVVVEWDGSKGAIEDLKHYVSTPATRYFLTSSFHSTLMTRLLHPGASTVEILKVYVSIIRAFAELDARGVLLEKVARPIRRYLKGRDDTVKVIVGGLLSEHTDRDGQDAGSEIEQLPELARELSDAHQLALRDAGEELDWDDMNWMPDPVDAAPDYKKSKTDVIGSLISLFDTREVFVKELQQALSERLLKRSREYDQETSVLELLKIRFGDSSLQACEVMLRDIVDSKRVDSSICAEQKAGPKGSKEALPKQEVETDEKGPEIHAKILSRLYWPTLQEMSFTIPEEVAAVQKKYSVGFEALKPSRKLTWLNGLGRVKVELDLEDRVFQDEVTTWQATVIYAFQSPSQMSDLPVTKTVAELAEQLSMSTSFVRSACLFWLSKQVLTETHTDTFQVLERLHHDTDDIDPRLGGSNTPSGAQHHHTPHRRGSTSHAAAAAAAAAAQAAEAAAKESATSEALAKMDLYWQFIVGMLTNQGAMPLQRIIMMLKMVVPGGFPFSSEEVKEFLGQRVAQGKLEIVGGGNYKIVK